uniref:Protein max n=1 Tax=Gopherus agassizii TaxID=38772 RepID=A0A452HJS8_9SAUR
MLAWYLASHSEARHDDLTADKRAHHNALERKRRDHIKDSFHSLRDSVPSLQGEKASRAQILDKATEYIQYMRRKNHTHQQDIDDLKRQNALLEQQGDSESEPDEPQSRKKLRMEAS